MSTDSPIKLGAPILLKLVAPWFSVATATLFAILRLV